MSTNRLALGLLLASSVACGGGARSAGSGSTAPSEYTLQVKGYLDRLSDNAVKQGYGRVVAGPVYGSLADDAKGAHDMTVAADDRPVLIFTAAKAGKYRIQVVMASCSDEPCRYGLQLNSK